MKISYTENRTRRLCMAAIMLAACFGFTSQAIAQSCGGSIGILNTPNSVQLTQVPLGAVIDVTLNPAKSNFSDPLNVSQVQYALTCANNDDNVPCTNGNDTANSGGAPRAFLGSVGGSCGATDGTTTDNGDGTVTFNFPPIDLDNAGCLITFEVQVNDYGTDTTPQLLTSAAEALDATCNNGGLNGSAAGSASLTVFLVPDIELVKEISIDGGTTWFDANDAGSAPYAEFPSGAMYRLTVTNTGTSTLTNVTINDPTLGIVDEVIANLAPGQEVVLDSGDIPALSVATVCDQAGTFENIASVAGDSDNDGDGQVDETVDDEDPANLVCVGIDIDKTGDAEGKVGDDVDYTITLSNLSDTVLEDCSVSDTLLGNIFGPGALAIGDTILNESYTVQGGDLDPLPNVATLSCTVVGPVNTVNLEASDDHEVDLLTASIDVTKDGPAISKPGDEVCYEIGFTNTGDLPLENCQANDSLLGALGPFEPGVPQQHCYTVQPGDLDPLDNEVTITCDVVGFSNQASDSDTHRVDLINPEAELSKVCRPDSIPVGDDINWEITITNTGDADLDCLVDDATAGFAGEPLSVAAGASESLNASRPTEPGDVPSITNVATASCTIAGGALPNVLDLGPAEDTCEVTQETEFCRTPGFWGTHAGTEKRRSSNLTQTLINFAGGSISVCGQTINNTGTGNVNSAVEAMCVSVQGKQQRQLARQLTAAALNCIASGGGANCAGTSVAQLWLDANAACIANSGNLSSWITQVDNFNNGVGTGCHETEFSEVAAFDGISPLPGPAGSSQACSTANGNGWKVVPAPGGETP